MVEHESTLTRRATKLWQRVRAARERLFVRRGSESDVGDDEHQALRRVTGDPASHGGVGTTTSTGGNGVFVGRIAGEDPAEPDRPVAERNRTLGVSS